MNILFLEEQPCIRAIKMAKALKDDKDLKLTFGYVRKTPTEFYGFGDEFFDNLIKFGSTNHQYLENKIKLIVSEEKIDLIHSHNWPDYLTAAAIDSFTVPVIHDTHDIGSIKKTGTLPDAYRDRALLEMQEKLSNEKSKGRIFVTKGVGEVLKEKYDLDDKKSLVFPNFVLEDLIPKILPPKFSETDDSIHLVYEGNLAVTNGHHYDLVSLFKDITKNPNIHMHIYAARDNDHTRVYDTIAKYSKNLHFYGKFPTKELLRELPKYDFGLALFNNGLNNIHLDTVLSNKVLEYVCCGLPVLTFPDKTQKEFIEKNKLGIVLGRKSIGNLEEILTDQKSISLKEDVTKKRFNYTVEKNINKLTDFYDKVLAT